MTTQSKRSIGLTAAAFALVLVTTAVVPARADGFPCRRDYAFENEISTQKAMCLPPVDARPEAEFDEKMAQFVREGGEYAWWALRLVYHGLK